MNTYFDAVIICGERQSGYKTRRFYLHNNNFRSSVYCCTYCISVKVIWKREIDKSWLTLGKVAPTDAVNNSSRCRIVFHSLLLTHYPQATVLHSGFLESNFVFPNHVFLDNPSTSLKYTNHLKCLQFDVIIVNHGNSNFLVALLYSHHVPANAVHDVNVPGVTEFCTDSPSMQLQVCVRLEMDICASVYTRKTGKIYYNIIMLYYIIKYIRSLNSSHVIDTST